MTCISKCEPLAQTEQGSRTKRFRPSNSFRPSPDSVHRQAEISLLAFRAYDDRCDALAFLNAHSVSLGGRPVDVAGSSSAGFEAVVRVIAGLAGTRSKTHFAALAQIAEHAAEISDANTSVSVAR